jgi:hypothetical protein
LVRINFNAPMLFRFIDKTSILSFLLMLFFASASLTTQAQINIVYKDKKADTLKLFENKKLLIDQLSQKEGQNRIEIDKIDQYTKTLAKANDSLANGLSQLKREVAALSKASPNLPLLPEVQPAVVKQPITPVTPVFNVRPVIPQNAVAVTTTADFNIKLDSIKAANAQLSERISLLQDAVSELKARPAAVPVSECSHALIYVLLSLFFIVLLFLFSKIKK